jgi:hypothetical protein
MDEAQVAVDQFLEMARQAAPEHSMDPSLPSRHSFVVLNDYLKR